MILVAVVVAVRLLMLLSGKSLWSDEIFSLQLSSQPFREVFIGSLRDVHPPLYFLVLHAFIKLFGTSEVVLRLPSFLFGLGTVFLIYKIARRLFTRGVAYIAVVFAALSPYLLQQSNEVRGYAMFAFLSTLSTYFLFKLEEKSSFRIPYVIAMLATILTEHYGWFVLLSHAIYMDKLERKRLLPYLGLLVPSICLIIYQSMTSEDTFKLYRIMEYLNWDYLPKKVVGVLWHFFAGYQVSMMTLGDILEFDRCILVTNGLVFVVGMIFFIRGLILSESRLRILAYLMTFMPIAVLILYPVRLDARYLSFSFPIIAIITARGLHE